MMMHTKPFLVYKSSAGSGKTYTLVKEYLKIVLANPGKIRNILAITFTNAAAAEMKERIIAALGDLSALSQSSPAQWPDSTKQLLGTLAKETGLSNSDIIHNAKLALTLILHNYADFSVSTIDSFAHKVIRSFAFDLRLPLNFDVELDQEQLLNQAIDLLVSRAGKEPALTALLVEYIESRTDEERSHYIEYDMARLAKTLMDEKGSLYIERLKGITLEDFSTIHGKLTASISAFEKRVQEIALQACQLLETHQVPTDAFYQGRNGIGTWFSNLAKGLVESKLQPNSYVIKTIEEDNWAAKKASTQVSAAIETIADELKQYYNQIIGQADTGHMHYKVHRLIKKHLFPLAVLCEIEKVMDEIKSEHSLLHISDFNKKISEIVTEEPVPFIYERIGERYQHYMIDEFQDTSGLQWQNLLPLIDNSLASGNMNLLVGDGKQAIYRWRNGDVEQFASLPELTPSITAKSRQLWQQTLERNYEFLNLDTNWRSLPEIIDFNNRFFGFVKTWLPESLQGIYDEHAQKKHPKKTGGYVQIDFVEEDPEEDLDYRDSTHLRILETIRNLKEKGHPLNDLTILCRANSEASAIARFLLEKDLSVISSESLLLNQSSKVNFILSVMRLINHAEDEISITEVIQFLAKAGKIEITLQDALREIREFNHTKQEQCGPTFTAAILEQWLTQKAILFPFGECRHLGLYEMGETIIRGFFAGEPTDPFLAFFMDVLYDYSNRFTASLPDFLEWWQENQDKFSVVVPEGVDAVRVMTIHKSKGLQFPVVIYPFADKDFSRPGKEGEWVEIEPMEETLPLTVAWLSISSAMENTPYQQIWENEKGKTLLDLLNMVYVAFTRPVEKLFVLTKFQTSGKFSEKNLAGFIWKFLQSEGLWSDTHNTYSFGENAVKLRDKYIRTNSEIPSLFNTYHSNPWTDKIAVRSGRRDVSDELTPASARGSHIHEIMEHVHTAEDVIPAIDKIFNAGEIDQEEADTLKRKILNVLNDPVLSPFYQTGITARNECAMYDDKGRFFRADRVILGRDSATVIDYKTGQPNPRHRQQINTYASIIQQIGCNRVTSILVYLDHARIELV